MKDSKQRRNALSALLIGILMLICSVSVASGTEMREKTGSITLAYEFSGVRFQIFKVGTITDSGIVAAEKFKKYHVDLNGENAAQTLAMYIERDNIRPNAEVLTDSDKLAVFNDLEKGVYMTVGENTAYDNVRYTVMPSLISLPYPADDVEQWDLRAEVKFEKTTDSVTQVSCLKVWKTASGTPKYPKVTVQLLRDGEIHDSVVLNDKNDWKYTWTDLDPQYNWTVTEKEFDADYRVDISKNNHVFTITNSTDIPSETTVPETKPTYPTKPTVETKPTFETKPTVPEKSTVSTYPVTRRTTTTTTRIPQTGQVKWPVPILSIAGVALILIGVLILRKNRYEK